MVFSFYLFTTQINIGQSKVGGKMSQKYDLHFRNQLRNPILNSSRILRSFVWLWPKEITSKTILMGSRMVEDILHSLDSYWAFREGPKSEGFWHHLSCYHQRMRKFKMYLGWGKCDWKWGKVWKAASKTSFHTKYMQIDIFVKSSSENKT